MLGRKVSKEQPANKFYPLDYYKDLVQFTSVVQGRDYVAALDQYGEIWFLVGQVSNILRNGLKYNAEEWQRLVDLDNDFL